MGNSYREKMEFLNKHPFRCKVNTLAISIFAFICMSVQSCVHASPAKSAAHQIQKIKNIAYDFSYKKIEAKDAAKKMWKHMQTLHMLEKQMDDKHPMQKLLHDFVLKWNEEAAIFTSLTDDNQAFVSELNAFFIRGYVKYPTGGKTLFPIFKP
jgi:hypothetical protein